MIVFRTTPGSAPPFARRTASGRLFDYIMMMYTII
jgi:hypothetical protein